MYRIALCDDEPIELKKTEILLEAYKQRHSNCNFMVREFTSVHALLNEISQNGNFDLLILDIYLPEITGIEGAKRLRGQGDRCPIIFMTSSVEHAIDAFEVDAVQYLLKPVEQERFFTAVDKALEHLEEEKCRYIALRMGGELRRIALRDIVSCESHGNYQYLTIVDCSELRVRMTLAELHALIGETSDFVRVGVAYLINLNHVDSMSSREILLDNSCKISVPRGAYPALKERYFQFYCER